MNGAARYARYSSDKQRSASIEDQFRECQKLAVARERTVVVDYKDEKLSGASIFRPGLEALMRDAHKGKFDIVFAESLDRLSRDQEDMAGIFKRLTFDGVKIVTVAEGEITHLHVGLKGTMNALYLKDLADKTRRGLRGRVEAGKSGGGICYAYRVDRRLEAGESVTGERTVEPAEKEIVQRIFREYVGGRSSETIAKRLNAEGIPGPGGGTWGPSTIHGHVRRGTGILNNEMYVGRLVWNRQHYLKNPDTGKRVSRLNPESEWAVVEVPELQIIDDETWQAAKARQQQYRHAVREGGNVNRACRPRHLFSGLMRCGECRRSFFVYSKYRLACSGRRERGICSNRLTIRIDELEARVLAALQRRFFDDGPFEIFCREFTAALNEERMEERASIASANREMDRLEQQRAMLVKSILAGVPAEGIKGEMESLLTRREELTRLLSTAKNTLPLLHPNMAEEWRKQITELRDALADDECEPAAREALRQMVEEIRLTPRDGVLAIDVKGDLARMLDAARPSAEWQRQITLVAGAGFEPATFGL
jgi:site-specific DNA recombinase